MAEKGASNVVVFFGFGHQFIAEPHFFMVSLMNSYFRKEIMRPLLLRYDLPDRLLRIPCMDGLIALSVR